MKFLAQHSTRLAILLLSATVFTGEVSAQILSNGGFELPGGLAANTSLQLTNGDPRLAGWTIGIPSGHIGYMNGQDLANRLDFPPAEGSYHVAFNGGDLPAGAWISQSFDTTVGEVYDVTFQVGRLGENLTPDVQKLLVTVRTEDGAVLASREAIPPNHGYNGAKRLTFIAATPRSTLVFLDTSTDTRATDLLLDAVSVSAGSSATIEVSEVAICWFGSTNRTYQPQYKSDLTTNTWVNLGSPIPGTGTSMCVRDAVLGQPRRLYQVVPLP